MKNMKNSVMDLSKPYAKRQRKSLTGSRAQAIPRDAKSRFVASCILNLWIVPEGPAQSPNKITKQLGSSWSRWPNGEKLGSSWAKI